MNDTDQYAHKDRYGKQIPLPVGKIVCVGRNFTGHAKELGNEVPETPILFIKSSNSFCFMDRPVVLPEGLGAVHYETEIAVLIKDKLKNANEQEVEKAIWGYGMALDLTLRDLQSELKNKGHPWEKAKSFDGACPVSAFLQKEEIHQDEISVLCSLNNEQRQLVKQRDMLWKINALIIYMSRFFTLVEGDVILTGTPEGVGELSNGDKLNLELVRQNERILEVQTRAVNREP